MAKLDAPMTSMKEPGINPKFEIARERESIPVPTAVFIKVNMAVQRAPLSIGPKVRRNQVRSFLCWEIRSFIV